MIVFCEDCGSKNELTDENMDNGRVVFKCRQCGYKNNYYLDSFTPSSDKPLVEKQSSDFVGGFIYHKNRGLIINRMPSGLTEGDLNILGKSMYDNLFVIRQLYSDTQQMTMGIPHRFTVVRPVDHNHIAVMIFKFPISTQKVLPVFKKLVQHLSKKVV